MSQAVLLTVRAHGLSCPWHVPRDAWLEGCCFMRCLQTVSHMRERTGYVLCPTVSQAQHTVGKYVWNESSSTTGAVDIPVVPVSPGLTVSGTQQRLNTSFFE